MEEKDSSKGGTVVSITNKLSDAVDIYDVFNPSPEGTPEPFTYTKLGTIRAGTSGKIRTIRDISMLQAMYTGTISELNNRYFYQFPIKIMSATQFSFGTPPPLSYTLEDSDRASMIQSFLFHRYAMANPKSTLARSLYNAIKKGDVDSINGFFSGTRNFSRCTLASWNAVMTWLRMFTSGWQGPYYLYETSPSPMPDNYVPVLVATLNIESSAEKNSAVLNLCSENKNGEPVFSSPPQTTTLVMKGDGTLGDANAGKDVPVSLTPVWMTVIQTTMKGGVPVSGYFSGPAVSGTVAGQKVVSSQTPRQLPKKPSNSARSSTSSSSSFFTMFDSIFNKLCQTIGLVVGILMLFEMINKKTDKKQTREEEAKSKAESEKDFQDKKEAIEKETASEISDDYASRESEISSVSNDIMDNYRETSKILQKEIMSQTMEKESNSINEEITKMVEDGMVPSQSFEKAVENLETNFADAQGSIENGDFSKASTTLSNTSKEIETTITKTASEMNQSESRILNNTSEALQTTASEAESLNTATTKYDQDMGDNDNDSGFNENTAKNQANADEIPEIPEIIE